MATRATSDAGGDLTSAFLVSVTLAAAVTGGVLWLGGATACLLTGRPVPHASALSGVRTLAHPGDPSRGWAAPMSGPVAYWTITGLIAAAAVGLVAVGAYLWVRGARHRKNDVANVAGLATRSEVQRAASTAALRRRGQIIRPTLTRPTAQELGYRIGSSRGVDVWTSIEDSMVILGPPRSGKGLHLVIPMLLGSPGPVITTSTRPDNVAATLKVRRAAGPVALFDPQGLVPDSETALRWSPVAGCEDPQIAMIRARALAAGGAENVDNRGFWQAQTEAALRAFLHAAALGGLTAADLYRWSLDPAAAGQATQILHADPGAAPGWADALDAIITGDPRTRDNSWAGIRTSLGCLADPRVLAAVTPAAGNLFDPARFLASNGTLYLLGTAGGVSASANLVAALIEDVVHAARRKAASSPHTRLDPPLALILDEAANYALPSLPALISEGGGTGITTVAVLQSLAQARARWGEHEGAAIWDAASVKVIMGGGSNARDLHDLSALIGERDELTRTHSRDRDGRHSTSITSRRVPILDTGKLRTLLFGTAILLLRAAPPIPLELSRAR